MKKVISIQKISIIFLLSTIVFMVGCTERQDLDVIEAYITVIDKLYEQDSGLNGDIKYIAIDTSKMVNITDEGKLEMLNELEEYGFIVLNMTFEELEEEGYIRNLYFEEGILFRIEDRPVKNNSITMNISKWRSGLGAIGYDGLTIEYKAGEWEIKDQGSTWIS